MGRDAKLREKVRGKVRYWYTGAGGGHYFGRVDTVKWADAKREFNQYIVALDTARGIEAAVGISVYVLVSVNYVPWLRENREPRTVEDCIAYLTRFLEFVIDGVRVADMDALKYTAADLKAWLDDVKLRHPGRPVAQPDGSYLYEPGPERAKPMRGHSLHKYLCAVTAVFAWGAGVSRKQENPTPCLPAAFRPFDQVSRVPFRAPVPERSEDELATNEQFAALVHHADDDMKPVCVRGKFRRRRPDEFRHPNPYAGFADMLKLYDRTGARTSELCNASVGDFKPRTSQIILRAHKRARRLGTSRIIDLDPAARAIVARACAGKGHGDPIFTDLKGRRWTHKKIAQRLQQVRERAGVPDHVTIYTFRHTKISETLMRGGTVSEAAKLAGTSAALVEKVYGHFRRGHLSAVNDRVNAERDAERLAEGAVLISRVG